MEGLLGFSLPPAIKVIYRCAQAREGTGGRAGDVVQNGWQRIPL